jgi:hypothetical protein
MNAVEPYMLHEHAMLIVYAKNQPEYTPLPASVDADGCVMTEWEPTAEDLATLLNGGRVRIWLHGTDVQNGRPLTPMSVETTDGTR